MRRQRGLAVIMAILLTALAATIAALMAWQQQLWVRQAENIGDQAQARAVVKAGLDWGRLILQQDAKNQEQVDHLKETWAQGVPSLPVENGSVGGQISDQQGLYNLNLLASGDSRAVNAYTRLLASVGAPAELALAVQDWTDPDQIEAGPGGAEDLYYLTLKEPYRTANQSMVDVAELYRVKGYTEDIIKKLRPFVTALQIPPGADLNQFALNVNTAPAEVLAAVFDIGPSDAEKIIQVRDEQYFKDKNDFHSRVGWNPDKIEKVKQNAIPYDVKSNYFLITVRSVFGRSQATFAALVQRSGPAMPAILWQKPVAY